MKYIDISLSIYIICLLYSRWIGLNPRLHQIGLGRASQLGGGPGTCACRAWREAHRTRVLNPGDVFYGGETWRFPMKKQWFSMWKPKILWVEDGISYVKLCCRSCLKSRTWYETENILMYWLLANQLSVQLGKHGLLKKRGKTKWWFRTAFPIKIATWVANPPFSHTQISDC
jgi:hypothetical protein